MLARLREMVPAWFLDLPGGQQMIEQEAERTEEERQELGRQLAEVRKERERALPALARGRDAAARAVCAAEKKLEAARQDYDKAWSRLQGAQAGFDGREGALMGRLGRSAPPAIDACAHELREALEATRRQGSEIRSDVRFNYGRGVIETTYKGNSAAVKSRCAALVAGLRDLGGLRCEYLPPADLAARLQKIRDSIPACAGVWNVFEAEAAAEAPARQAPLKVLEVGDAGPAPADAAFDPPG